MISDEFIKKLKNFVSSDMELVNELIASLTKTRGKLIPKVSHHIFSSGGKRLRPIITILAAKLCQYQGDGHIKLAAAIEFIHTATLLHDDVVDQSNLRRGKLTANKKWSDKASILVGDYLLSQAFRLMTSTNNMEVTESLSQASIIISEGEVKQLEFSSSITLTYEKYLDIISSKTAELFAAAARGSAIISHETPQQKQALYEYGHNLGVAFQIIDDVLDYFGSGPLFGKEVGNDFYEGKITLPIILLNSCDKKLQKQVNELFEKDERSKSELKWLLAQMEQHNIRQSCNELASQFLISAKANLQHFADNDAKAIMLELLDFSLNRVY